MSFFNLIKPYFQSLKIAIGCFIKKYPAEHSIALLVICIHLIPFVFCHKSQTPISKLSQKLEVSTYTLSPSTRVSTKTPSSTKRKKNLSNPKIKAFSPRSTSKDAVYSVQKICDKLQQIEQSTTPQSSSLLLPELPKETSNETEKAALSYQTILLDYLEKNIFLPEQGTVDLQITLLDNGKPISIKIIHSTSKINADFLCTELENHTFPSFIKDTKEKTFILSFQSHGI